MPGHVDPLDKKLPVTIKLRYLINGNNAGLQDINDYLKYLEDLVSDQIVTIDILKKQIQKKEGREEGPAREEGVKEKV